MNYPESQLILDEIKKAKRILLNCHRHPDSDSIGSTLAMRQVLLKLGKEIEIICPSEDIPQSINYLVGFDEITTNVNFRKFDFSKSDLFLTLDSSSWDMVSGLKDFKPPEMKIIVVDHHLTNTLYGDINLVDTKVTSVGEMLFSIFEDWAITIEKDIADCLMAGIIGDTGAFRYPGSNSRTLYIGSKLIELGANKDKAVDAIYRSDSFELLKFYGDVLSRFQIDREYKFVWSAIPHEIYKKLKQPSLAKESAASMFTQVVEGTDFGFVAVEQELGKLSISFRSRTGFNTSEIASELGGGGHIYASGAKVELPFNEAVEKVLEVCRKYAQKTHSAI